jgi:hypothetical protein
MDFLVHLREKIPSVRADEQEIAPDEVTASKHPRATNWWTRLQGRPAFGRASSVPSSIPDKPHHAVLSIIRTAPAPVGG